MDRICTYCGQAGHLAHACPRRVSPHALASAYPRGRFSSLAARVFSPGAAAPGASFSVGVHVLSVGDDPMNRYPLWQFAGDGVNRAWNVSTENAR